MSAPPPVRVVKVVLTCPHCTLKLRHTVSWHPDHPDPFPGLECPWCREYIDTFDVRAQASPPSP